MDADTKKVAEQLLAPAQEMNALASLMDMGFAVNYLTLFGYLAKWALNNVTREDVEKAIKLFQQYFGIQTSGIVEPKTLKAMQAPRCGFPDVVDEKNPEQAETANMMRLVTNPDKLKRWAKQGLKYYIKSHVAGIPKTAQTEIFKSAWQAWDDVCGAQISRVRTAKSADLIIDTARGQMSGFDGPGGVLAWAYLPDGEDHQLSMQFDLDETWINDPRDRGTMLFNVACHEFGHMLGLTHSKKSGALMAPYYNQSVAVPQFEDDIPRVQALYGRDPARPAIVQTAVEPTANAAEQEFVIRVRGTMAIDGFVISASPKP